MDDVMDLLEGAMQAAQRAQGEHEFEIEEGRRKSERIVDLEGEVQRLCNGVNSMSPEVPMPVQNLSWYPLPQEPGKSISSRAIRILWDYPQNADSAYLRRYHVEIRKLSPGSNVARWETVSNNVWADEGSVVVHGIIPWKTYHVRVKGENARGFGPSAYLFNIKLAPYVDLPEEGDDDDDDDDDDEDDDAGDCRARGATGGGSGRRSAAPIDGRSSSTPVSGFSGGPGYARRAPSTGRSSATAALLVFPPGRRQRIGV